MFVSSVQSHLMALRSLLYKEKDVKIFSDEDIRRRLGLVDFESIIPRKVRNIKCFDSGQLRSASECQYDSLAKPLKSRSLQLVKYPLPSYSFESGTHLLHLAYVGSSPSKSVKRTEKAFKLISSDRVLGTDSTKASFDVSDSARGLVTSVLDEIMYISVDEAVRLEHVLDSQTGNPASPIHHGTSDDYTEPTGYARNWTEKFILDILQNSLNSNSFDNASSSEILHVGSNLDDDFLQLSSSDCDQAMTVSARGAVRTLVDDTLCFCVETTHDYLDFVAENVTEFKPSSSDDKLRKQYAGSCTVAPDELLPPIADTTKNKIAQLELSSIVPASIGREIDPYLRQNLLLHSKKSSNAVAKDRTFPGLKSGNNCMPNNTQPAMAASRIVHKNRPSEFSKAATLHAVTGQSSCYDSHHAKTSHNFGHSNKKHISPASAYVSSLPRLTTSADNRNNRPFNNRQKYTSAGSTVRTSLLRSRGGNPSYDDSSKALVPSIQSEDHGAQFNAECCSAANRCGLKSGERKPRETKVTAVNFSGRNGDRRPSPSLTLPSLPASLHPAL